MRRKSIFVAYASNGFVRQEFLESLLEVQETLNSKYHLRIMGAVGGPLISKHRNILSERFLASKEDYLLFADSDMAFRAEHIVELINSDKPIVGALYFGVPYGSHETFTVALKETARGRLLPIPRSELPESGCLEVDSVGMGLCLIKRKVIETLGANHEELRPFAETLVDGKARGEDVTFCLRAKEAGFTTWLNLNARVGHVKSFTI